MLLKGLIGRSFGLSAALLSLALVSLHVQATSHDQHSQSLTELLNQVQASVQENKSIDQDRLDQFLSDRKRQAKLLKEAQQRLAKAESEQQRLKNQYDRNEQSLREEQDRLTERSGQLGEVFGVVKQQAQDLSGVLQDSLITSEYPQRMEAIEFADLKRIPSLEEIKGLWWLMTQEMTATSEIKTYQQDVAQTNGVYQSQQVLRVGPFTAINQQGEFLKYDGNNQQLSVFARQPSANQLEMANQFFAGQQGTLLVDPSRGNLLELIGRTPTVKERIDQAGTIGLIIIALGALGLLLALWRMLAIMLVDIKVRAQYRNLDNPSEANPLGRILNVVKNSKDDVSDSANLEVRTDEALLKEVPKLELGLSWLKMLAAIAPLLGLLGTVTGMIGTFQSITVFGTSDPKLMAGGISQALMTTVLGLCVAIPLLFCHSLIADRSRRMVQLLQQVAFSALADYMEQNRSIAATDKAKPAKETSDVV